MGRVPDAQWAEAALIGVRRTGFANNEPRPIYAEFGVNRPGFIICKSSSAHPDQGSFRPLGVWNPTHPSRMAFWLAMAAQSIQKSAHVADKSAPTHPAAAPIRNRILALLP